MTDNLRCNFLIIYVIAILFLGIENVWGQYCTDPAYENAPENGDTSHDDKSCFVKCWPSYQNTGESTVDCNCINDGMQVSSDRTTTLSSDGTSISVTTATTDSGPTLNDSIFTSEQTITSVTDTTDINANPFASTPSTLQCSCNFTGIKCEQVSTTSPGLKPVDPDYVTKKTFWISTGVLIVLVVLLLAATIYLFIVHFRRSSPKPPTSLHQLEDHVKANKYAEDGPRKPSNIQPSHAVATYEGVDEGTPIPTTRTQQTRTPVNRIQGTGEPALQPMFIETPRQSAADINLPPSYEQPMNFRKNNNGFRQSPQTTAPNHQERRESAGLAQQIGRHSKPAALPKPPRTRGQAPAMAAIAESAPTIPKRHESSADSLDGYDNDEPPMTPPPNLPKRNHEPKNGESLQVYENE